MRFPRSLHPRALFSALTLLFTLISLPVFGAGSLIISEFRTQGLNVSDAARDEFIEIYNDNTSDHTVSSISGTGYAIAASDGVTRCTIPNGTVIPARGHWLCVNSASYALGTYPAGNGTTATGDGTYTTDIPLNAGIALFNNDTGGGSFSLANRFDAVGSTSEANTLYKEGTGYPALGNFNINSSLVRDTCGKGGAVNTLGPCIRSTPKDTNDNAADFYFVDTNGTSSGGMQRLGAPGPENLSSPISGPLPITNAPLDSTAGNFAPPNLIRDFTQDDVNNSHFGTISVRRRYTNNTGANVTRLRFRITDLDTFPAAAGFADLRPRTSTAVVVAGINDSATCAALGAPSTPPCTVTVQGTTLEQAGSPNNQFNGGGFMSSMGAGTVTLGTPLAPGASIALQFLIGIQQTGDYRVDLAIEALPAAGGNLFLQCNTEGCTAPPMVSSIVRADPNPTTAASVDYTVTFSQSVTGVDASDFGLTTTGGLSGASVTNVSGSGATYTVTVGTGTGSGTIRLDVADDDTINVSALPLGGVGAGNGDFTNGEVYTVTPPCGNGTPDPGEECDNGTSNSDTIPDACRTDCTNPRCGDGVTDTGEQCDDGNTVDTDACSNSCQNTVCGDGIVDTGEQCDTGASNSDTTADACRTDCTNARCGDGVLDTGEQCDTGASNSDTIPNVCRTDCTDPHCGDGVVDTGETCDDGNIAGGDGCSGTCQTEFLGDNLGGGGGCSLRREGASAGLPQALFAFLSLFGILGVCRRGAKNKM
jgi:cysteine-rich repeat protein